MTLRHAVIFFHIQGYIFQGDLSATSFPSNTTLISVPYSSTLLYSLALKIGNRTSGMTQWLCIYPYEGQLSIVDLTE